VKVTVGCLQFALRRSSNGDQVNSACPEIVPKDTQSLGFATVNAGSQQLLRKYGWILRCVAVTTWISAACAWKAAGAARHPSSAAIAIRDLGLMAFSFRMEVRFVRDPFVAAADRRHCAARPGRKSCRSPERFPRPDSVRF
jgi:hypothetical protein